DGAAGAFARVLRDVRLVQELGLAVLRDLDGLVMAVPADLPRDGAVALDRLGVTVIARDASGQVVLVIEHSSGEADLFLGRFVARRAPADGLLIAAVFLAL